MRVLAGIRLSDYKDSTTSPQRQRESVNGWAKGKGATVIGEAVDLDVSASKTTPFERPELGAWLRDRADEFDALAFWRGDRAVRSMADMSDLARWARKHDKLIVFVEGIGGAPLELDFRTMSPVSELMVMIMSFAAQMESQAIKERVLGARDFMRRVGRWPGGQVPYGYKVVDHPDGDGYALALDDTTAGIVRRIAKEVMGGKTLYAVSRDLDAEGIPTAKGGKWSPALLSGLLRSEHLRGYSMHEGRPLRGSDGHPRRDREAVLDDETWAKLQAVMAGKKRGEPILRTGGALLVRVAYCAGTNTDGTECGRPLYGSSRVVWKNGKKTDERVLTYRCTQRGTGHAVSARMDLMDKWAEERFLENLGHVHVTERQEDPGQDYAAEIQQVRESIKRLRADREMGLYDGPEDEAEYAEMMRKLLAERRELEAMPVRPPSVRMVSTGRTYADDWHAADKEGKRRLLADAGVRIKLTSGKRSGSRFDYRRLWFEVTNEFHNEAAEAAESYDVP
ncbi:recombinase family protein [Streptomyces sp. SAI-229]|uniref:recombinase family protein n=1 Tax=Streptomyces sp. SAI-229 TaxID=3377731 RepID=UPI003C7EA365